MTISTALTSDQIDAMDSMFDFNPELGKSKGLDNPMIGSRLADIESAVPDNLKASLQTAAAATAAAAPTALGTTTVTAVSATASSAVATADATAPGATYNQVDTATIATLANALKAQLNINATENADFRARQAQDKTAIDNLTTTVGTLVTLCTDLRTKYNALANGIDAL